MRHAFTKISVIICLKSKFTWVIFFLFAKSSNHARCTSEDWQLSWWLEFLLGVIACSATSTVFVMTPCTPASLSTHWSCTIMKPRQMSKLGKEYVSLLPPWVNHRNQCRCGWTEDYVLGRLESIWYQPSLAHSPLKQWVTENVRPTYSHDTITTQSWPTMSLTSVTRVWSESREEMGQNGSLGMLLLSQLWDRTSACVVTQEGNEKGRYENLFKIKGTAPG